MLFRLILANAVAAMLGLLWTPLAPAQAAPAGEIVLMAYPGATLLRLTKHGLEQVDVKQTDHFRVMREFCDDPKGFVEAVMEE